MSRWNQSGAADQGARYAARFADLAASGVDVHGEARFCASFVGPGARVLDAGCGTGRVAIRLAELGYDCVGVDLDPSMLAEAERAAPDVTWVLADLATVDLLGHPGAAQQAEPFDLVVAAGNVFPFLTPGTGPHVVARLAAHLRAGAVLVSGFGLDGTQLPAGAAHVDLAAYDAWCADASLVPEQRFASWDRDPYTGGGYAVSVHRRA
jgi:SAM-dependent methyltransferase